MGFQREFSARVLFPIKYTPKKEFALVGAKRAHDIKISVHLRWCDVITARLRQ